MTLLRLLRYERLARPFSRRWLVTLGIRREDPARIWERRVALTPEAISSLVGKGKDVKVEVESCQRRCFPDEMYQNVGASIVPRLSGNVDVVLGIKEPSVSEVEALKQSGNGRNRTWMVFSHTHKGQVYNTPLLASFMDPEHSQTLIDHELLAAPTATGNIKRVAAFGWYAGAVGAGEALSMTGLAMLKRSIASPLLHTPRPYTFSSLAEYKEALRKTGDAIRTGVLLKDGPIVIGLTGAGNVSQGAIEMLDALGVEWLQAGDLKDVGSKAGNQIYSCAIPPSSYFKRNGGGVYSREAYYASPESFTSVFAKEIAPYLTTLINGAGWQNGFPRVITNADMEGLIQQSGGKPKLVAIQDVTCDIRGNLEFVDRHASIDNPYFEGPAGILISTVDILPAELAADASEHFSKCILPYIQYITSPNRVENELSRSLDRATIVKSGVLFQPHQWLQPRVDALHAQMSKAQTTSSSIPTTSGRKQRVLLLGSGLVAGPAVEVFSSRPDLHLVVASNNLPEARGLAGDHTNVETMSLDVSDQQSLAEAVKNVDVVVSLLPAPMHAGVAKHCITNGKHLVTASYISPEMKALDQVAVEKDVVLLGECGLDPGIDSMAAMRILDRVHRERRTVTSFISWCGGLPEPAASNVPLGYKFSWSPRAVLTAAQNDARFKLDGKIREISGDQLLANHFPSVQLWKALALEGLANRDSIPYAEKYGLGPVEGLTNLFRGTLRYPGFSKLLDGFRRLGLLSKEPLPTTPTSWNEVLRLSATRMVESTIALGEGDMSSVMKDVLLPDQAGETIEALQWLSLLSGRTGSPFPLPNLKSPSPIDYFAALLSHRLAYEPHERDSALLHHAFTLAAPHTASLGGVGSESSGQNVTASLLCYGTPTTSAMSTTVGKTLAFAALRVLDGHVKSRGVKGPYEKEVWEGVLDSLEEAGVRVEERWK